MHDLAFADSARPEPVRVLRLPMLPYSIGHEITLLAQRNPLLFDLFGQFSDADRRSALVRACLVCHRTWRQQYRHEQNMRLWAWLISKADLAAETEKWLAYRQAGTSSPPQPSQEDYEIANGIQNEEPGRAFGGSHLARVLAYVAPIHRSFDAETPFDVPLGMANHLYLSGLEMAGNARIENVREAQVRLEMEGHRAAIEKEKQCQH